MKKPVLVLVDLQNDFLARRPLEPAPELLVARAGRLLQACREARTPAVHVRLTVTRDPDNRMPHWRREGRWICVEGTPGHEAPASLRALPSEPVVAKRGFSAFENGELSALLARFEADTVILAGLYLHNCIRATAIDAWLQGREVIIAADATGSRDPLDAESTLTFLQERGLRILTARRIEELLADRPPERLIPTPAGPDLASSMIVSGCAAESDDRDRYRHRSPRTPEADGWTARVAGPETVRSAVCAARAALPSLQSSGFAVRSEWLGRLADLLADGTIASRLATEIAQDVGKPVRDARAEIERCRLLLGAAIRHTTAPSILTFPEGSCLRRVPHGVVAAITPWNHPLAIPIGKIAPALLHGNAVVWKPAPAASRCAISLVELMTQAGWPEGIVSLVLGDAATARSVMGDPGIDAITLTGGPMAGHAARRIAALRHVPLQAELGGNNVAVVWSDADLSDAARRIASAAFGFAGQRCTANRRVVVLRPDLPALLDHLVRSTRELACGDPLDSSTVVGPLISEESRDRIACTLEAARAAGFRCLTPHESEGARAAATLPGWYLPPTIVVGDDPQADIVQRESFGPVLVVQPADDWEHALDLAGGVEQGLVAAVFTASEDRWHGFRDRIRAGILKRNRATADAGVEAPFGGWKASGIGPPEHGPANREFFTRMQAIYE